VGHRMNNMSHSRRLRSKIKLTRGELDSAAERLWTHPRLREVYPQFLFLNHAVIRTSVPLMQAAATACEKILDTDPVAEGMLAYFRNHIREEAGTPARCLEDSRPWCT